MDSWQNLADAIIDEDRRLRGRLGTCPRALREACGPGGGLSCKELLGHIAFWDDWALRQLAARLDPALRSPAAAADVETLGREAVDRARGRPFGDVLADYLEVTGALVAFIAAHWHRLDAAQRESMWVPLKHRRHHRIELEAAIEAFGGGDREMPAEA